MLATYAARKILDFIIYYLTFVTNLLYLVRPHLLDKSRAFQHNVQNSPVLHPALSQKNSFNSHFVFLLRHNLMFSYLRFKFSSCPFPSGLPTKTLHAFIFCPMRASSNAYPSYFDHYIDNCWDGPLITHSCINQP